MTAIGFAGLGAMGSRVAAASDGTLTIMVGGEEGTFHAVEPLLRRRDIAALYQVLARSAGARGGTAGPVNPRVPAQARLGSAR
jgi:hypothetical protein